MKSETMRVSFIDKQKETHSKLLFVKKIKDVSHLGLKECKDLCDSISYSYSHEYTKDYFDVKISSDLDKNILKSEFKDIDVKVEFNTRDKKLKRLLYSNQETLISDMMMENWKKYVSDEELDSLSYNECKEIGVKKIIKKYKEYISKDMFYFVTDDINRINQLESKDIGFKFMKFNEEFGEMNAEYIKFKGFTYKEYDKDELKAEMADALQVLLSIYDTIGSETGITFSDILVEIIKKNKKWENKILEYKRNK